MQQVSADLQFQKAQAFHKGEELVPKDLAKAEKIYNEILNHNLGNVAVLTALGMLHAEVGHWGLAIQILHAAIGADPNLPVAWNAMGMAFGNIQDHESADLAFANAGELFGKIGETKLQGQVWSNRAGMRVNNNQSRECVEFARKALICNADDEQAEFHLALGLLEQQEWAEGFDRHESRHRFKNNKNVAVRNYAKRESATSAIKGGRSKEEFVKGWLEPTPTWDFKTKGLVVIHGEEGLGDEIMFASCVADAVATGAEIVLEPSPRLHALFSRSFPGVEVHGTHKLDGSEWLTPERKVDFKIAAGSLPMHCRRREQDFPRVPYLKADPSARDAYRSLLPEGKLRVGVSWQGGVHQTHVHLRSLPLSALSMVLEHDVDWVSLQYHPHAAVECKELEEKSGIVVHHWPDIVGQGQDYDKTASLVAGLDLVISARNSVVHLCGAMGVPCWVLSPLKTDWRMGSNREHPAWYGRHVKMFRQGKYEKDWGPVIERLSLGLTGLLDRAAA